MKRICTFGFQGFVAIPESKWPWKLAPTGEEGIPLRFENNNTAYCILRIKDNRILTSIHIIFWENNFPHVRNTPKNTDHQIKPWNDFRIENEVQDSLSTSNSSTLTQISSPPSPSENSESDSPTKSTVKSLTEAPPLTHVPT
ncbi:hypothetical protein O181_051510 [Austropuccinia psidii MF-1]|uniref:Retroviral polymerase SH3-like domain-containing protein n=1 Tax=Austropuccinia psidii MF-1 TaxID=1389203 RepID=A0A9Q3HRV4_9BASI|nr:hypothetical protein [Austropuccinia psidii MF-1]